MDIGRRTVLSIIRQKGKLFILLLTVIVIGIGLVTSMLIRNAILETNKKIISEMNPSIISLHTFTENDVAKISESSHVDVVEHFTLADLAYYNNKQYSEEFGSESSNNIMIYGTSVAEIFQIKINKAKLISGRTFSVEEIKTGANVAVVSKKLADVNGFKVGQILPTLLEERDHTGNTYTDEGPLFFSESYPVEIVGIIDLEDPIPYDYSVEGYEKSKQVGCGQCQLEQNQVIMPFKATVNINERKSEKLKAFDNRVLSNSATTIIVLDDAQRVKEFVFQLRERYGKSTLLVSDYTNIEQALEISNTIVTIANNVLWISIVLTSLILSLLSLFFVRSRRDEIGLLFALGEKKKRICFQVFAEIIIVGLIGLSVAIGIGFALSHPISAKVTNIETEKFTKLSSGEHDPTILQLKVWELNLYAAPKRVEHIDTIKDSKVKVNLNDIITIYTIGFISICVATIFPMVWTLKMNPKRLLYE